MSACVIFRIKYLMSALSTGRSQRLMSVLKNVTVKSLQAMSLIQSLPGSMITFTTTDFTESSVMQVNHTKAELL